MQFTRLRLNGFKSFVDPAELVIGPGLTGVVGPNGCGKSNLLEALRWVMGESRARQMRGDTSDDVIFAGTDRRSPKSTATVELVIDNSDHLAPVQFNQTPRLEISRRIVRSMGSVYRINGKEARARDVQMLFADAASGATSPALVRQGSIGELISAKPKARRRILEDAAGIAGLYQRRHEGELKLRATETNLERVDDVLDQLGSQLAALERQAAQARRYRKIAEDLRTAEAMLLYLRWTVAEKSRVDAEAARLGRVRDLARTEAALAAATRERETAAEALPPLREEETIAAAIVQRLSIAKAAHDDKASRAEAEIGGLEGRLRQLSRDIEREETLSRDADSTLARLAEETASLRTALEGREAAEAVALERVRVATERLGEAEADLDQQSEAVAKATARAATAERHLRETTETVVRLTGQKRQIESTIATAAAEVTSATAALDAAMSAETAAKEAALAAEGRATAAEASRTDAEAREAAARTERSEADARAAAVGAEVATLTRMLREEEGSARRALDQIEVAPGYEAALGAALGDDLDADVLDGDAAGSGWRTIGQTIAGTQGASDGEPLLPLVTAPEALRARLAKIRVVDAATGDGLQASLGPGERLVSREGDLWRWDGLRIRAADAPSAAARRLQQKNRLATLSAALAEAEAARDDRIARHDAAAADLAAARDAEVAARAARRSADQAGSDAVRGRTQAETARDRAVARHGAAKEALAAAMTDLGEAETALEDAKKTVADLPDIAIARAAVDAARGVVDTARTEMIAARGAADDTARAGRARARRLEDAEREIAVWTDRRDNAAERLNDLGRRRDRTAERLESAREAPATIRAEMGRLLAELDTAEQRSKAAADATGEAEGVLRTAEAAERAATTAAGDSRAAEARAAADLENAAIRVEEAAERITETLETDAASLAERFAETDLPTADRAEAETVRLRRQRDQLGAVNLRADEDAQAVAEERDALAAEKADLEQAVAKLRRGIAELNREGRTRLLDAFEQVNEKFGRLFRHLFGGGEARLTLVESDDPLEAGLEILCQPPGKRLSTLGLLSGGEQTLTALSLIFAVFLSNPSPVCVLDEVDAPLDDANVTRFCGLLDEMRRLTETRFLIITHHAITMSRMDRLFGVTMAERGVSQLVSVDLNRAAELVDA